MCSNSLGTLGDPFAFCFGSSDWHREVLLLPTTRRVPGPLGSVVRGRVMRRARGREARGRWERQTRRMWKEWVAKWGVTKKAKRRRGEGGEAHEEALGRGAREKARPGILLCAPLGRRSISVGAPAPAPAPRPCGCPQPRPSRRASRRTSATTTLISRCARAVLPPPPDERMATGG